MPADPYKSPGDWTSLPNYTGAGVAGPGGKDPDVYAAWLRESEAYYANKGRDVSSSLGQVGINPDNYKVAGEADYMALKRKRDEALARKGVQVDNRIADYTLGQSGQSRARQQEAAMLHGAAAMGLAPSAAAAQQQMALDAQTNRAAALGGARGIGAVGGAYGASLAAGAQGRMQETQAGYRGAGQGLYGMRGADIGQMRQSQDQAYALAGFEAAQRARNDAMGRAYLGQEHNMALEQLAADQAYEAQKANNQLGVAAQMEAQRRLDEDRARALTGAIVGGAGAAVTAGAGYAAASNAGKNAGNY